MGNHLASGTYMLRKPFVLVYIRFRVRARHHEETAVKMKKLATEDTEVVAKKNQEVNND